MDQPRRADPQRTKDDGDSEGQHGDADGRFGEDVHRHRPFFALFGARARARALMLASSAVELRLAEDVRFDEAADQFVDRAVAEAIEDVADGARREAARRLHRAIDVGSPLDLVLARSPSARDGAARCGW